MKKAILLMTLLSMMGCDTPAGKALYQRSIFAGPEAHRQADKETCVSMGYKEGAGDFKNCMLQLHTARMMKPDSPAYIPSSQKQGFTCHHMGAFTNCN